MTAHSHSDQPAGTAGTMPRCTGFRITGYDGREVWRLLHEAAAKRNVGEFMKFYHNVVNFGLGKQLHQTTVAQFHKDVTQPGAMAVAKLLCSGTVMEDLRRVVVNIIAKDERLHCPHCRSHGLKWFHALCDMVRNHGQGNAELSFYRPAGMLHFIGPYRAFCRLVQRAVETTATHVAPPPDVRPCAMNTGSAHQSRKGRGTGPDKDKHKHPHPSPVPEERPVGPMVGVAPAVPRPQSPSRSSAIGESEWRRIVAPDLNKRKAQSVAPGPAFKRSRRSKSQSTIPTSDDESSLDESSASESDSGQTSLDDDDDEEVETAHTHTKADEDDKTGARKSPEAGAGWDPVSRPQSSTSRQTPVNAQPRPQMRAAAAMGLDWL